MTIKNVIVLIDEINIQDVYKRQLSFRVGGPIDRFDVYAGNGYERGNIIAEIDPRDFRIRKERAEAVTAKARPNSNA